MGCSACGAASVINNGARSFSRKVNVEESDPGPCEYSKVMLEDFEERLVWFKEKGLFIQYNVQAKSLNKYIGIVKTSLNILNRCKYRIILSKVSDLVDLIITLQGNE